MSPAPPRGAGRAVLILRRMVGRAAVRAHHDHDRPAVHHPGDRARSIWGQGPHRWAIRGGSRTVRSATSSSGRRPLDRRPRRASSLAVFFVFFRFSSLGLAMRATALDQEAALAAGHERQAGLRRVVGHRRRRWPPSPGVTTRRQSAAVKPQLQFFALLAFPAIILGGLDSPGRRGRRRRSSSAHPDAHRRVPDRVRRLLGQNFDSACPSW